MTSQRGKSQYSAENFPALIWSCNEKDAPDGSPKEDFIEEDTNAQIYSLPELEYPSLVKVYTSIYCTSKNTEYLGLEIFFS